MQCLIKKCVKPFLCIVFLSQAVNLYGQPEERTVQITSSNTVITNIPFDLHLEVIDQKRQVDTSFAGIFQTDGLVWKRGETVDTLKQLGPFIKGKLVVPRIVFSESGLREVTLLEEDTPYTLRLRILPGFISLLPPLLAILLALIFRQVLISLFAGVWLGATFLWGYDPFQGLLRVLDHYLINALANPDHVAVVLFSLTLGGMVGIMSRSGGTQGIVSRQWSCTWKR